MRRAALLATTLLAFSAGMALAQSTATDAKASDYQAQVQAWLQSVVGPSPQIPAGLVQVKAAGDHYVFSIPVVFAGDAHYTADGVPQGDGKWAISNIQMPSPINFQMSMPSPDGSTHPVSYAMTIGTQTAQMLLDTTFATATTMTSSMDDLAVKVDSPTGPGSFHIDHGASSYTLQPTTNDRVTMTGQAELDGYHAHMTPPNVDHAVDMNFGKARVMFNVDDLSRGKLQDMIHLVVRTAVTANQGAQTGSDDTAAQATAGQAMARELMTMLPDLLSGMGLDETFENVTLATGGLNGTLHGGELALSGKSAGGDLTLTLKVAADGLTLPPQLGLGERAALIPTRIAVPLTVSGIPAAQFAAAIEHSANSDEPPTADVMAMLASGKVGASLDNLVLDVGGAELRGSAHVQVRSPTDVSGAGQFTAMHLDALQQKLANDPELAQGGAVLVFLKGIGRTTGDQTVWDVNFSRGHLIVNGQDLAAMMGGGGAGGSDGGADAPTEPQQAAPSGPIPPNEQLHRK